MDALFPYQRRWVNDPARFKFGLMARQVGKDFCAAAEGIRDCVLAERAKTPTTWMIAAPSERQSVEALLKWKEWMDAFKLVIADISEERDDPRNSQSLLKSTVITFPGGSRVIAVPGRPETVRGFTANVVLTEALFFEDFDRTWRAMFPSITNPLRGGLKKVRIVSTPNGVGGKGAQIWAKHYHGAEQASRSERDCPPSPSLPERGSKDASAAFASGTRSASADPCADPTTRDVQPQLLPPNPQSAIQNPQSIVWSCHRVNIHDAIREGLPLGDAEELRAGLDDPEGWDQEYELNFLDQASVLLPYEVMAPCENPLASETAPFGFWGAASDSDPIVLGIEFGLKRDLTVCWTLQFVANNYIMTREVLDLDNMATPEQIALLRPRIERANRVCFDYTGAGMGMGDFLVKEFGEHNPNQHRHGKIELCTFTNPLKVEIFSKLRMEFDRRTLGIPVSRVVREDLHSVQRVATGTGVTYRAPHTGDGHADHATALALAVRAAEQREEPFAYSPVYVEGRYPLMIGTPQRPPHVKTTSHPHRTMPFAPSATSPGERGRPADWHLGGSGLAPFSSVLLRSNVGLGERARPRVLRSAPPPAGSYPPCQATILGERGRIARVETPCSSRRPADWFPAPSRNRPLRTSPGLFRFCQLYSAIFR